MDTLLYPTHPVQPMNTILYPTHPVQSMDTLLYPAHPVQPMDTFLYPTHPVQPLDTLLYRTHPCTANGYRFITYNGEIRSYFYNPSIYVVFFQTNKFTVEAVSLGHLKRIIVGHDGTGNGKLCF